MNKKIMLLFITILFLCSGCTAKYTLTVNDDLSIHESFSAMEGADFFNQYEGISAQRVVGFILEPYLEYFNSNGFHINQVYTKTNGGIEVKNDYTDFKDYKGKSEIYKQYANDWSYIDEGEEITLSMKGAFSHEAQDQSGQFVIDDAEIEIVLPFEVSFHNADSYDEDKNSYVWKFDQSSQEREIKITFSKTKKVDNKEPIPYAIIIGIVVVVILIILIALSGIIAKTKERNRI